MKRFLHLLLVVSFALTSCTESADDFVKDDTLDPKSVAAKVLTFSYNSERFEFKQGSSISVFAASADDQEYAADVSYTLEDDLFTSDKGIAYPEDGSSLEFYAIYPSTQGVSGYFEIETDQSSGQYIEDNDLRVASTISKEASPELEFESKVIAVDINCDTEAVEDLCIVAQHFVEYNILEDSYLGAGSLGAITPYAASGDQYQATIAPQELVKGVTMLVANIGDQTFTWNTAGNIEVGVGSKCSINIELEDGKPAKSQIVIVDADGSKVEDDLTCVGNIDDSPIYIAATDVRSTTVIVDVEIAPEIGNYVLYSMPLSTIQNDYGSDLEAAAMSVIAFWQYFGVPIAVDNKFIFNESITDFDMASQTEDFSMDTDYIIFAFGVGDDYTITSDIYYLGVHTTPMSDEDEQNYAAWVGDWKVTSSGTYGGSEPAVFEISIAEDKPMESYLVTGWDQSIKGDLPIRVTYDVNERTLNFPAESFLGKVGDTEELVIMRSFADLGHGEPSYITGVFSSLTAKFEEGNQSGAVVSGFSSVISSTGAEFQISNVAVCGVTGYGTSEEVMRLFAADEQGTPVDYPKGPYTLEKL